MMVLRLMFEKNLEDDDLDDDLEDDEGKKDLT